MRYRFPSGALYNWQFERDGKELDVEVAGPITLDDGELMVDAALQGCGLAYVWEGRARPHIAAGRLIQCLDDWCAVDENLFLYYPSRRYVCLWRCKGTTHAPHGRLARGAQDRRRAGSACQKEKKRC